MRFCVDQVVWISVIVRNCVHMKAKQLIIRYGSWCIFILRSHFGIQYFNLIGKVDKIVIVIVMIWRFSFFFAFPFFAFTFNDESYNCYQGYGSLRMISSAIKIFQRFSLLVFFGYHLCYLELEMLSSSGVYLLVVRFLEIRLCVSLSQGCGSVRLTEAAHGFKKSKV